MTGDGAGARATPSERPGTGRRAFVLTVSDGAAAGVREDRSGEGLAARLVELGFDVRRGVVADDRVEIERVLREEAERAALIVTTGGTGLSPRDVTPEATLAVVDFEIRGFPELMRAEGARSTVFAYLSRAAAGVLHRCLIVNTPGSPKGALESLAAIEPLLDHALETVAGPFDHSPRTAAGGGQQPSTRQETDPA